MNLQPLQINIIPNLLAFFHDHPRFPSSTIIIELVPINNILGRVYHTDSSEGAQHQSLSIPSY